MHIFLSISTRYSFISYNRLTILLMSPYHLFSYLSLVGFQQNCQLHNMEYFLDKNRTEANEASSAT